MNHRLIVLLGAAALAASACTSAPERTPTHRWVAQTQVPRTTYVRDNINCESQSGFEGSGVVQSVSFEQYKHCMVTAGYRLESW